MTYCANCCIKVIAAGLVTVSLETGFSNALSSQRTQQTETIVFRNVSVLPMDHDATIPGQDVVVQDGTITAIGPTATLSVPRGALVVNGKDKFLMPGLTDMHVHLPDSSAPPTRAEDELFLYLANGITTVRSMAGFENHLGLRERVRQNQLVAPSLALAGPGLDGNRVKTPEDGAREVRQQKAAGYDLIKILPGLSRASYDAIVSTARETGMPYVGHVPTDVGIEHALESGQQTIEHLDGYLELLHGRDPLTDEAFQPLIEKTRAAGIWNVPTMAVMSINVGTVPDTGELLERSELQYVARSYIDDWLKLRAQSNIPKATADIIQTNRMHLLKGLHDAGAGILFGTDSPQLFNVPGFSIYREAHMMEAAGLSRYEVLRSATVLPSVYLRRSCGVVSVGACGDVVLYARNPLDNLDNLRSIDGVMARGHWITREGLQRRLAVIRQAPENYRP
jgi:imidazolonepropionase-like amidohydrolase